MSIKNFTKILLGILALTSIFIWVEIVKSPNDNSAHLYFLNVEQGDSSLIEKGNYQILIDGGPDDKVLAELGKIMPVSDRKIEMIVLTHPHADHLIGLNQILDRYEIGAIYSSGVVYTTNGYLEFLSKIREKNINLAIPQIGEKITPFQDSTLTFLWPGEKFKEKTEENLNNTSEVLKFCYFSNCALFTGDIETGEQKTMFEYYSSSETRSLVDNSSQLSASNSNIFQSKILKLPHHGSTNGTNQLLLDKVKPDYAVIQVGADNKYGHPHAQVLDLLQKGNIRYFRTDRDGTVEFVLSQTGIVVK